MNLDGSGVPSDAKDEGEEEKPESQPPKRHFEFVVPADAHITGWDRVKDTWKW